MLPDYFYCFQYAVDPVQLKDLLALDMYIDSSHVLTWHPREVP